MKKLTYEQVKAYLNSRMYENGVRFSPGDPEDLYRKAFSSMIEAIVDSINENIEEDLNLNSIVNCGVKYTCIFGKTDIEHVEKQLRISKEENLNKIENSIKYLCEKGLTVFYDAEHYFDGYKKDKEYAVETLISAKWRSS